VVEPGHRWIALEVVVDGSQSPTASPEDALRMAMDLKPNVAVAIHGSSAQNREFQKGVQEMMAETKVLSLFYYMVSLAVFKNRLIKGFVNEINRDPSNSSKD